HLGNRPRSDPLHRRKAILGGVDRVRGRLLDPRRSRTYMPEHLGATALDAERMERVIRERGDAFGIRREHEAERAGSRFGQSGHQSPVRAPSLVAGDLLLAAQAFWGQTGPPDPQAGMTAPEVPHQPSLGIESGVVVLGTAPGGGPLDQPPRARTPGLDLDPARGLREPDGHRSVGGPRRAFGDPARGPASWDR